MLKRLVPGAIRPAGWSALRMQNDLRSGFVGHFNRLCPELFADAIYGADRLTSLHRSKDVGAITNQSDVHNAQFLWWNSETQSNWRDGWLRHVFLTGNDDERELAQRYVQDLLSTQDADGYLGIYSPELRFQCQGENGEVWAQATALRGLLAFGEANADSDVVLAVQRALDCILVSLERTGWQLFNQPGGFAGVSHGLMLVDVLDRMTDITQEASYRNCAVQFYERYSTSEVSENDAQWPRLLDPARPLAGHGVHTWEHLRAVTIAATHTGDPRYTAALQAFIRKAETCLTPCGGPIGDEWISGRTANATETGYEYCSITELLDSYLLLLTKTGDSTWADRAEHLFFNAALGARHPSEPSIAYLKTDNSYSMTGVKHHDRAEPEDATQTRYRYSPVHKEAAACCVPNAGRTFPSYVQSQALEKPDGLAIALYGPCTIAWNWCGVPVTIGQATQFPDELGVRLTISTAAPVRFTLHLRRPIWAAQMHINGPPLHRADVPGWVQLTREWHNGDTIAVDWEAVLVAQPDNQGEIYFQRGPLIYALPIADDTTVSKTWPFGAFRELVVHPRNEQHFDLVLANGFAQRMQFQDGMVSAPLTDSTGQEHTLTLVPVKGTVLRRVTFPLHHG